MSEYLVDHRRVFNAGDYFDCATPFTTRFNADVEYPLQPARPGHGCPALRRRWLCLLLRCVTLLTLTPPGWCQQCPVVAVGREYTRNGFAPLLLTLRVRRAVALACAMVPGRVDSGPGDQGDQSGDEIQRLAKSSLCKTGFEPNKGFETGDVDGQNGWTTWESCTGCEISTDVVNAGKQALHLSNNLNGSFSEADIELMEPIDRQFLTVRARLLRVNGNNSFGGIYFWAVDEAGEGWSFLTQIAGGGNNFYLGNYNSDTGNVAFEYDVWHELVMRLDFAHCTVTARVDGVLLGALEINTPESYAAIGGFGIYTYNDSANDVYADQVHIVKSGAPIDYVDNCNN